MSRDAHLDLLLINSPVHDYSRYPKFETPHSPPLGILSIATAVAAAGFAVDVVDAELGQLGPDEILGEVRDRRPTWVGINSFSVNISVVREVVRLLAGEPVQVVIGGPHVSNVSDDLIRSQFGSAPLVVRGDGEAAMIHLLQGGPPPTRPRASLPLAFDNGMLNRKEGPPHHAVNLDEVPMIDRRFSRGEPFDRFGRKWFGLTLSRGCLFRCAFCAGSSSSNGVPYRASSLDRVVAELDYLVGLGATGIRIFDDLPFRGKRALLDFLERCRQRYGDLLVWDISFPLQYCLSLDDDEWLSLASGGVQTLISGVEAADPELRANLGKRIDDARLMKIIESAGRTGIALRFYFIIGLPGESAESIDATLGLAKRLALSGRNQGSADVRCLVFGYKPMPGSRLWAELIKQGHDERELLEFADFEVSVAEFQKHAWRSSIKFSELTPAEISDRIDRFYGETAAFNSEEYDVRMRVA